MSQNNEVTLYGYFRSSCSYRTRIALNIKNIPYKQHIVSLIKGEHKTPEYQAIQPLGMVPALAIDGEVISQSMAIIEYLDETRPDVPLLPSDPKGRAKVREIAYAVAMDIQPVTNMRILQTLEDDKKKAEWVQKMTSHGFKGIETLLAKTAGKYCYGDSITLADLALVPQVYNAARFNVDMTPYPIISRVNAALLEHPAFKAAHPHAQPDTPEELRNK
ncbi:Glutathione S-transferase zeta-1 [Actinomortierella ambigua]|uniref:Glutathione S-transferase zeta-1 n=1 Tax=Actinomortierella ambigua TaxID=1343610 RepID=A0A9P6PZB5_9FUNG|nr:Glutathione S-transferase zeta-1 [Actinomortierella ambigua]KAG0257186.1 Glutathione S-transferase zeta-1 [Actinomortierella ambigua]